MTALAIPPWGNYSIALAASVECLRVTPWSTRSTTPEIMKLGAEASPEFSCLAFKATTGYFIKAAMEGVEYGVMVNSVGTCRLRYYRELQQKILKDRGLNLFIFGLGYDGIKPPLIRHFDPTMGDFLRCSARAFFKVHAVDAIEKLAWETRARELHTGDTTRLMNTCLKDLDDARTVPAIRAVSRAVPARFQTVPTDAAASPLRIGLLGEASILRDSYLNHNLEETLGSLGVEVRNFFLLGNEMAKIFNIGLWSPESRGALTRLARPYLKSRVGGHALESVAYTLRCAREQYDGVIHVSPTGCMPEISIRPILRKISQDHSIPILELSFDEHSSHVGVVTRLEAFTDILRERRKQASS
jgi:predicted nucleotide-binding protein (sugar kinase/HSP70/actin superfamily)